MVFENDRVRVLEYADSPGDRTTPHHHTAPHRHPDSVMYTLSSFRRRLVAGDNERDVELPAGQVSWLPAQEHAGENIGDTQTRVMFIELKEPGSDQARAPRPDPSPPDRPRNGVG